MEINLRAVAALFKHVYRGNQPTNNQTETMCQLLCVGQASSSVPLTVVACSKPKAEHGHTVIVLCQFVLVLLRDV